MISPFPLCKSRFGGIFRRIMPQKTHHHLDDVEIVRMDLPLDRDTVSWLARIARDDAQAAEMVASMIRLIRQDDEAAHATKH